MVLLTGGGFTTPATATAVLTGGVVTAINVSGGSGYTSPPTVTIATPITVLENSGPQTLILTGISDGDANTQMPLNFTFTTTNGSNVTNPGKLISNVAVTYDGASSINSTSFLTFTLQPNDSGTGTINLTLMDPGPSGNGNLNSITVPIVVTVLPVNQAPTLNAIPGPVALTENGTGTAIAEPPINLSNITDGLGDTGQILSVTATSSNPALIPNSAAATATVSGGIVTGIGVTSGGSGYAFPPVVTISGGGGTGATATAVLGTGASAGVITSINFTGGSGYTSAPTITIAPPTATAVAVATLGSGATAGMVTSISASGAITSITVTNQGSGYSSTNLPNVTIAPPASGGVQATATAIVTGGVITGITITNAGSGYSSASPPAITIDPPLVTGTRATATATFTSGGVGYLSPPMVTPLAAAHRRYPGDGVRRGGQWRGHRIYHHQCRLGLHLGTDGHGQLRRSPRRPAGGGAQRHGELDLGREQRRRLFEPAGGHAHRRRRHRSDGDRRGDQRHRSPRSSSPAGRATPRRRRSRSPARAGRGVWRSTTPAPTPPARSAIPCSPSPSARRRSPSP